MQALIEDELQRALKVARLSSGLSEHVQWKGRAGDNFYAMYNGIRTVKRFKQQLKTCLKEKKGPAGDAPLADRLASLVVSELLRSSKLAEVATPAAAPGGFINFTLTAQGKKVESATAPAKLSERGRRKAREGEEETFCMRPMGYLRSCFQEKFGTPRQGSVARHARGSLTLCPGIDACALEGLGAYSHVWLIFVFHKNTNKRFRPKVKPPRLRGKSVGVYGTRTPHRWNPIGQTLARLEEVEGRTVLLSGIDLIDGTPVLDIKPYHPADNPNVEKEALRMPKWVVHEVSRIASAGKLIHFRNENEFVAAVCESVRNDPRPLHCKPAPGEARGAEEQKESGVYGVMLDACDVIFRMKGEDEAEVLIVSLQTAGTGSGGNGSAGSMDCEGGEKGRGVCSGGSLDDQARFGPEVRAKIALARAALLGKRGRRGGASAAVDSTATNASSKRLRT